MNRFLRIFAYLLFVTSAIGAAASPVHDEPLIGDRIKVVGLDVAFNSGSQVVGMDLNLDSLKMSPNNRFILNVVVTDGVNKCSMPQVVLNGRRQHIMYERYDHRVYPSETTVVRRINDTPLTIHYSSAVHQVEWMKNSDVLIEESLCGCGDILDNRSSLVRRLRPPYLAFLRPEAEARKDRSLKRKAYLDFPVDKTGLYPGYRNNPTELEKIVNTINIVKEDKNTVIIGIEIRSCASPEGTYEHNAYLAGNRAGTLKDYVCRIL